MFPGFRRPHVCKTMCSYDARPIFISINKNVFQLGSYNQIANYVYTQSEINIKIKDDAPCDYMAYMKKQVAGEGSFYGGITGIDDLRLNLAENCVPEEFMEMDIFNYQVFLDMRRRMMAQYIREYYESLV